jgi:hypothetical protein
MEEAAVLPVIGLSKGQEKSSGKKSTTVDF